MKKLVYIVQFIIVFILTVPQVNAQYIEVKASLDTNEILIGDQINYTIIARQPADIKIAFPLLNDTLVDKLEIIDSPKIDTTNLANDLIEIVHNYKITSFDTGFYQIPPQKILVQQGNEVGEVETNPQYLLVNTLELDTTQAIFDVKLPYEAPLTFKEVAPYLLYGGIALLIIGILIYIINRRINNKPIFFAPKPKEPAHVIALRSLDKLKSEKVWQKGLIKEYYTGLTDVIRVYLENQFNIQALEKTSDETIQELKSLKLDDKLFQKLNELFAEADLVKFAKQMPQQADNELHLQTAYSFIEQTKPVEITTETKDENSQNSDETDNTQANNAMLNQKPMEE